MTRKPNKDQLEDRLDHIMKKAQPAPANNETAGPDEAPKWSRSIIPATAALAVLLLFSVAQVQAPPTTITGPIAQITVNANPQHQPVDVFTPTGSLTVVPYESYFQCQAGCTFFRAPRRTEPVERQIADKPRDI